MKITSIFFSKTAQRYLKKNIFNNFQILHNVSSHFDDSIAEIKSMRSLKVLLKLFLKWLIFKSVKRVDKVWVWSKSICFLNLISNLKKSHHNFFPNEVRLNIYGFNFFVVRFFFRYNFAQTNFVENFWCPNLHSFGYSKQTSWKVRKDTE
jgi:hypothetical protein